MPDFASVGGCHSQFPRGRVRPELSRFFFTVQPTQLHGIDGLTHPSTIERLEADTVLLKARIVGEREPILQGVDNLRWMRKKHLFACRRVEGFSALIRVRTYRVSGSSERLWEDDQRDERALASAGLYKSTEKAL